MSGFVQEKSSGMLIFVRKDVRENVREGHCACPCVCGGISGSAYRITVYKSRQKGTV